MFAFFKLYLVFEFYCRAGEIKIVCANLLNFLFQTMGVLRVLHDQMWG